MSDLRNPLITGVTNNAGDRSTNTLPTSYAVNQLFAGASIEANVNANNLVACGNYRFNSTTTNLPIHMLGAKGILTVLHDRPTVPKTDRFGSAPSYVTTGPTVIRQIAWPDGPNDVMPYTRTATPSFNLTNDDRFQANTAYWKKNSNNQFEQASVNPGDDIPANTYYTSSYLPERVMKIIRRSTA